MTDFTPATCPNCLEATEPEDHFPVADGAAYHVLCYQAAVLAAGEPDPFPVCYACSQIIYDFKDGKLQVVMFGEVNDGGVWRPLPHHPGCAPLEEPEEVACAVSTKIDKVVGREPPLRVATNDETGAIEPEAPSTSACDAGDAGEADTEPDLSEAEPPLPQDYDGTKPVCPRCAKPVQRSPTRVAGLLYHKTCGAMKRVSLNPMKSRRSDRPRCVLCTKPIDPEKLIECGDEGAPVESYHKHCYRKACIAAGMPDPYPYPADETLAERLSDAKAAKQKARKEAMVNCGICTTNVVRTAFPDHVVACAAEARAKALAEDADGR
jgi:hypothetical protein